MSEWTVTFLSRFSLGPRLQPPRLWPGVPGSPTLLRLSRLPAPAAKQSRLPSTCPRREVQETSSYADPPSSCRLPHLNRSCLCPSATRARGSPLAPASRPGLVASGSGCASSVLFSADRCFEDLSQISRLCKPPGAFCLALTESQSPAPRTSCFCPRELRTSWASGRDF